MSIAPIAVALALLASFGCGPSTPTADQARAWAEADRARVEALATRVLGAVESHHLLARVRENDPRFFELEAQREHDRALFRQTVFTGLVRETGVLGARVRLLGDPRDAAVLGEAGTPEPALRDGVRAADGADFDGKKLGYGVYGVDAEDGGVVDRPGYELEWETTLEGRNLRFTLFLPAPRSDS
jgi:hypothetical protein